MACCNNKYLVTGHTPTERIDPAFTGRITQKNNYIAIDCGAAFCGMLSCFCLETREEIYVCSGDGCHPESGASKT